MNLSDVLVILGCGGHARSIADVHTTNHPDAEVVFVDDHARPGERILGFRVEKHLPEELRDAPYILGIGDNGRRRAARHPCPGRSPASIISTRAYVSASAQIGEGVFVAHGCHLGPEAVAHDGSVLNTGAIVEHEVVIGAYSHIAPGAVVCGRATIGDESWVGAGATVIQGVRICERAMIGAGAVVIRNVEESGTYAGCPLRRIN